MFVFLAIFQFFKFYFQPHFQLLSRDSEASLPDPHGAPPLDPAGGDSWLRLC